MAKLRYPHGFQAVSFTMMFSTKCFKETGGLLSSVFEETSMLFLKRSVSKSLSIGAYEFAKGWGDSHALCPLHLIRSIGQKLSELLLYWRES